MPRIPTDPLPELTVRGTVRKNRLYTSEEDIQRALQMVRDGVYTARAARLCNIPFSRLHARVIELKARNELDTYWGKNAPGYLAKLQDQEASPETSDAASGVQKNTSNQNFSVDNLLAAVEAVKTGMYTANAAHNVYSVPLKLLYKAVKGDKPISELLLERNNGRPVSKLTRQEEQVIVDYAFALDKVGFPVTWMNLVPLAMQFMKQRGNQVMRNKSSWGKSFVRRHQQELRDIHIAPSDIKCMPQEQHSKRMFDRLAELYDKYNFHLKPSRVYACEAIEFNVERWEADKTSVIDVEMFVAANAVGYHILPPCVVYANEEDYVIPDFLGLPEAGFVTSEEKKVTAPIMAEWFRSVFLHYLPNRTAEDPVVLVITGHHEWFSPELLSTAEQEHVHLVTVVPHISSWSNPIKPLLDNLQKNYEKVLDDYKKTQVVRQVQDPPKKAFFPVTLRAMFSDNFTMFKIQNAFKSTGVFPLKPDIIPKEDIIKRERTKTKIKDEKAVPEMKTGEQKSNLNKSKTDSKELDTVATISNQEMKLTSGNSDLQSINSGDDFVVEIVLNSDGTCNDEEERAGVVTLMESMQKSLSASMATDKLPSSEADLDTTSKAISSNTISTITPVKNPTVFVASTSSVTTSRPSATLPTVSASSDTVTFTLQTEDKSSADSKQDSHFNTDALNSIVVVKNKNGDRRSYVLPKKITSTQPKATDVPSLCRESVGNMATPIQTAVSGSKQQQCAISTSSVAITGASASVPPKTNIVRRESASTLALYPVKVTKIDEPVRDESFHESSSVTMDTSLTNTPGPSNSTPAKTGDVPVSTDDHVTSVPSSTGEVESDPESDNLEADEASERLSLYNTQLVSKQPITMASSVVDRIQSVIAKNTHILSSLANNEDSKSEPISIPSVSGLQTIQNSTSQSSSGQPVSQQQPVSLLPNVPLSVIAAKLQQHVLSQPRKPKSVQVQTDPLTLLRFAKDAGLIEVGGAEPVSKQTQQSDASKSDPKSSHGSGVSEVESPQTHGSTTSSTKSKSSQLFAKSNPLKSMPSSGSKATGTGLASKSKNVLPTVSVTTLSHQQQQQLSKSKGLLTRSELGTLSKIARAFNSDVANVVLAVKSQQKQLENRTKPSKVITSPPERSNKQPQPQTSASPAGSAKPVVPTTPVVPIVTPPVPLKYNQLQQTPGGHIILSAGVAVPLAQQPLVVSLPQGVATKGVATGGVATTGVTPPTAVTNIAPTVTNTNLTPTVTMTSAPTAVIISPSSDSPTIGVPSVMGTTPAVTNTNLTPNITTTTQVPVKPVGTVPATVTSSSTSYSVKPKVTSDRVTILMVEKPTETVTPLKKSPRKQALVVRREPEEISSEMDKRDSHSTLGKKSLQKRDKVATEEILTKYSNKSDSGSADGSPLRKSSRKQGQAVTKELSANTSRSGSRTSGCSGATLRVSPRKQVVDTGVEPRGSSNTSEEDAESHMSAISGVRKRKATLISSPSQMSQRKMDSVEEAKKLKLGARALTEGRKTRAQTKGELSPSKKTRSSKR